MKSKIYVHNLAHIQDARLIEHNKSELLRLLGPVLRRKKYAGLFEIVYSRPADAIYQIGLRLKSLSYSATYESWMDVHANSVNYAERKALFLSFIRDMEHAAKRIKPKWGTTFLLKTPSETSDGFDDNQISFDILQFVPK